MRELLNEDVSLGRPQVPGAVDSSKGDAGKRVRISGFEEWTLGDDGPVVEPQGHYDQTEYDRQLEYGAVEPS